MKITKNFLFRSHAIKCLQNNKWFVGAVLGIMNIFMKITEMCDHNFYSRLLSAYILYIHNHEWSGLVVPEIFAFTWNRHFKFKMTVISLKMVELRSKRFCFADRQERAYIAYILQVLSNSGYRDVLERGQRWLFTEHVHFCNSRKEYIIISITAYAAKKCLALDHDLREITARHFFLLSTSLMGQFTYPYNNVY